MPARWVEGSHLSTQVATAVRVKPSRYTYLAQANLVLADTLGNKQHSSSQATHDKHASIFKAQSLFSSYP